MEPAFDAIKEAINQRPELEEAINGSVANKLSESEAEPLSEGQAMQVQLEAIQELLNEQERTALEPHLTAAAASLKEVIGLEA